MAGAQAAPPARAATPRPRAPRTVSIAAHVENLHPHHDGRPCRQRVAPGRLGRPGRRQCGAADPLRPTRPPVPPPPPPPHRQRPPPADRDTDGPSSTGHAEMFDSHQTFATTAPYSWFTL